MFRCFVLLLGSMIVSAICPAQDLAELEVDHNLQAAFVTPHTDWAVPYALGKTRVLFFVRGRDTESREVVDVPVACNDPQGVWTLTATELYTGTTATAQFAVK